VLTLPSATIRIAQRPPYQGPYAQGDLMLSEQWTLD